MPAPPRAPALLATALLVAVLAPAPPAAAHEPFACPNDFHITLPAGDFDDALPDVDDGTYATAIEVPGELLAFDVRGWTLQGRLGETEAWEVRVWHDFVPGMQEFHLFSDVGGVLVRIELDNCVCAAPDGSAFACRCDGVCTPADGREG